MQSIEIVIPPMDIQNSFLTLFRQSDKSKYHTSKAMRLYMKIEAIVNEWIFLTDNKSFATYLEEAVL